MSATQQLADFIVNAGFERIPETALKTAREAILDAIGVALAGAGEPASKIMTEYVRQAGGRRKGVAGVIAGGFRTAPSAAALANGTLMHALDYDDVAPDWLGHPTAPLLPVVLALGEAGLISGKEALAAYIIGFEVESRVGRALGSQHYAVGWHATGTVGTMGAVAAAARLLRLDPDQTRNALGIAASEAGGLRQNFGTMTKPFHAGNAARNGVVAATLAQKGFTADPNILESSFLKTLGGEGYSLAPITEGLGQGFAISAGVAIKPYPCCRLTHRCLDAALYLAKTHHLSPEEVAGVECHTSDMLPQILIHHRPRAGAEGKFSMEYCVATAILDGEVCLGHFTEKKVQHPRSQRFLEKVGYRHPEGQRGMAGLSQAEAVTIRLRNGRELRHQVLYAKGEPQNPLTHEELIAKFRGCASYSLSPEASQRCLELVLGLEKLQDIATLAEILVARARGRRSRCA